MLPAVSLADLWRRVGGCRHIGEHNHCHAPQHLGLLMLDHDERHATVGGYRAQKLFQRFQTPGRSADADDRKSGGWEWGGRRGRIGR